MTVIMLAATVSLVGSFAYIGTVAQNESIEQNLQQRVALAQTTARHVDYVLASVRQELTDVAAQAPVSDVVPPGPFLERAFARLAFSATQVFLVDRSGNALAAYPPITTTLSFREFAAVGSVLQGQPFAVSRYRRPLGPLQPATIAAVPVLDAERCVVAALVMSISLTSPRIRTFTQPIGLGATGYMDLVDLRGDILASTHPERIGKESDHRDTLAQMILGQRSAVSACHDCHTATEPVRPQREVLALAALEEAQWGVTVRQNESEVFAITHHMQRQLAGLMIVVVLGALVLVYLTTRSVIIPIQTLTAATQRMAAGDLSTPIRTAGPDEIGALGRSFDAMRTRLRASIDEIQKWNQDLDGRVQQQTAAYRAALAQKEQLRTQLLHRVIAAQEDERKRISRELHDESCQLLTALAYNLDNALHVRNLWEIRPLLEQMHELTKTALTGVHRIIFDLRPTMLDNLGLIPALHWYAETRLTERTIPFTFRESQVACRLPPPIETAIFRVVQEAINNIASHSKARHADFVFELTETGAHIRITDDGIGFDAAAMGHTPDGQRGLGLLGMEERMNAIGGHLRLRSILGGGTAIQLDVRWQPRPAPAEEQVE